jgi:predicted metal-dependent hydrolase
MTKHTIEQQAGAITFDLVRSRRKTVGITVHADGRVVVRAPQKAKTAEIEAIVSQRAGWILKKQRMFADLPPPLPPPRYVDGERHYFLGRPYTLRLLAGTRHGVTLDGSALVLRLRDPNDAARKQRLLTEWYRARAREIFAERLAACHPRAAAHGIPFPDLKIRLMKRRWGSCSSRGSILLNLRLIQTPLRCIDYVIFHELAHLKVHAHNKAYYALLDELLPGWRARREELNSFPVA